MPTVDVDGDKLHFYEAGTGTPVIFVHGSCGGGGQWGGLSRELSDDFRCISLDLFGSGKSETCLSKENGQPKTIKGPLTLFSIISANLPTLLSIQEVAISHTQQ